GKFEALKGLMRKHNCGEKAERLGKRIADLGIRLKGEGFYSEQAAYYFHPLGMIGWLMPYSTCFCHRDFTVEEFKTIVKELRKGALKHTKLWIPALPSGASPSDKTYEATVKELNRVMNKYEINTCLRKIHFLAQAYHETHLFQSMQEYTSSYTSKYDPYRGRGLIHLTHKKNYEKFSADMNDPKIVNNPSIVATDIIYAFESGGWFWKKGTTLSNNKPVLWKYPNSAPKSIHDRIKIEGANCSKSIVSYGNSQETFGVLDLNVLSDNDWGNTISWLVNGGANGFDDRIKYRNLLKEIMKYESCKNKK
ncbi:glycoside hydrolase family 19 protein, partial [Aggregatibacter actinomycetemcomitans]|uniref:glycoside hydrolase family 19 protein n=1 Tax=Aggregatibacter actinomycetemcomitans TaxID=714 RepID=UPI0023B82D62